MAGYPISQLKKATEIKGQDILPIQQDGVTKQIEKSILDQATIIAGSGSQSSGIIRKEGTFVLTSGTLTNFTIENAVGRKPVENEYVDDAQLAAGMKVYVFNNASIQHTVIHGANSWPIAAGETLCFYWTGSRFTLHNVSVQNVTVRGDTKLTNVSALQSLATTNKIPVIGTDNVVKYTTPAAITDGYAKTTEVNNALTDYRKKTDNSNEGVFKVPANTTVKTPINVNSGNSQKAGYLLMIEGNTSAGDLTYVELYLIRCGYSGNHVTQKLISSSGSKSAFSQTFGVSEDGYLTITSDIAVSYYIF